MREEPKQSNNKTHEAFIHVDNNEALTESFLHLDNKGNPISEEEEERLKEDVSSETKEANK